MSTNAVQEQWLTTAVGRSVAFVPENGNQCVDPPKDYSQTIFPIVSWTISVGYGNAKDLFLGANLIYFEKITNDPNDPTQIPQRGDVIVWDGWAENPDGHIAVVTSADQTTFDVIQEDGSFNTRPMHTATFSYAWHPISGWLRPIIKGAREMTRDELIWSYRLIAGVDPSEQEIANYLNSGKDYATIEEEIKQYFANGGQGYEEYRKNTEKTIADLKAKVEANAVQAVISQPVTSDNAPPAGFFHKDTSTGRAVRSTYQTLVGLLPLLYVLWNVPQVQQALGGLIPLSAAIVPATAGLFSYVQNNLGK